MKLLVQIFIMVDEFDIIFLWLSLKLLFPQLLLNSILLDYH